MLTHCYLHNFGIPKELRVEDWIEKFPPGEDDDDTKLLKVARRIRKELGRAEQTCSWKTEQGVRCDEKIGGQKVLNFARTVGEIVRPEVYMDDGGVEWLLRVLEASMYCHLHTNERGPERVEVWKRGIIEIRKRDDREFVPVVVEGKNSEGVTSLIGETGNPSTESSGSLVLQSQSPQTQRSTRSMSARDPSTFWPAAYDVSPFQLILIDDKRRASGSASTRINEIISKSPTEPDLKSGYIYIYEVEGNPGFIKIGYTTESVQQRQEAWTFDCNRKAKLLYPILPNSGSRILYPRHVEALCHAELAQYNKRLYCGGCVKQHKEWFEISTDKAIGVVEKWSRWSKTYLSG